jgi:hypothetical protein
VIEQEADDAEVGFVVVEIGILQEQSKGAARRPFLRGIQFLVRLLRVETRSSVGRGKLGCNGVRFAGDTPASTGETGHRLKPQRNKIA